MNSLESSEATVTLVGFQPKDLYARREKIFTRFVGGFYQRLRFFTGWPLLVGYFALPWINFNERQAVLFDLPARAFHLFGLTLWPQDLWLLGWLLIISAFTLFAVTTVVGRLWCGYTCPQTVWTAIFMWIEQITEGPRHQRIRLDSAPWSYAKTRKRIAKHGLWLGCALLTGLTFVGYFTPIRELISDLTTASVSGWPLFWMTFFTLATYGNAGWLREQVCIYMCPYARFQSAMIDGNTLTVSYDAARGEPRGSRKRNFSASLDVNSKTKNQGDCIDCKMCVQVCPTGIDIRNGLQYECIGCAHCIDACNQVMTQIGSEPGLVRYTTQRALEQSNTHALNPRFIGYSAIATLLVCFFAYFLISREPLAMDILRDRGALFQTLKDGGIRNDYQLKVLNKTQGPVNYQLRVLTPATVAITTTTRFNVLAGEVENLPLQLVARTTSGPAIPVILELCQPVTKDCVTEETSFFSPKRSAPEMTDLALPQKTGPSL